METVGQSELKVSDFLRAKLLERSARNPSYSLRAFARDLKVSHTYLSLVLNGKKRLPPKRVIDFSQRLGLGAEETQGLLETARAEHWRDRLRGVPAGTKHTLQDYYVLELDRFRVLSEWYHLALLDLTLVHGFQPDPRWVARQLGITRGEVIAAVKRLERLGLLEIRGSSWRKTHAQLDVPAHNPAAATRRFHTSMIEKAARALRSVSPESYEARYIAGSVMAINGGRLPEAKRRIARFRKNLLAYLTEGEATDLYQLNVQLFPLLDKKHDEAAHEASDAPRASRAKGRADRRSPKASSSRAPRSRSKRSRR